MACSKSRYQVISYRFKAMGTEETKGKLLNSK